MPSGTNVGDDGVELLLTVCTETENVTLRPRSVHRAALERADVTHSGDTRPTIS